MDVGTGNRSDLLNGDAGLEIVQRSCCYTYHRWALMVKGNALSLDMLLGPLCWSKRESGPTVTFRTREHARQAKRRLRSYRERAQPVKVKVTVEVK